MARLPRERSEPRISANDLALYMLSSETGKLGIIRRAKFPQTPPIIRYRDVRQTACAFLADPMRSLSHIVTAEEMFQQRAQDTAEPPLRRDDARASVDVLHSLQGMRNRFSSYDFRLAPTNQPKLVLAGVEVSVRADLICQTTHRSATYSGAAVFRFTQDDAETEAARSKRRDVGHYVATLARIHAERNLHLDHPIGNRACLSIDVQHGEIFQSPEASSRRIADLENACRFIAAIWETVGS